MDPLNQDQEKNQADDQTKVVLETAEDATNASIADKVSELTEAPKAATDDLGGAEDGAGRTSEVKKTPLWQWIILAVLILAIVGVLWWYFFGKTKKASNQAPPEEINIVENIEIPGDVEILPPDDLPEEPEEDLLIDTDNDGLTDNDELNIWQTDPDNPDTDGDGYLDGEEVSNGYNPNGEGTIEINEVAEIFLSTPEGVLDVYAQAFNNSDIDLLITALAEDHPDYQTALTDGASLIDFMQMYFENKTVSFEIFESTEGETPDILNLQVNTLLDGDFFQQDPMKMIKIGEEWKILE